MVRRDMVALVRSVAATRPALFVAGPRQSGKSTLLRMALPDHLYVTLDRPANAELAEEAGEEFLRRYPPPVIIDEVQYAPTFFRHLKAEIDENRTTFGRFALTGSQVFPLFEKATESLAGRISILNLNSFSLHEMETGLGKTAEGDQLMEWMLLGGYPEIHAFGISPDRFYAEYVNTLLDRDVRHVLNVRNVRDFDRFLRLLASRTGQLLDITSLASDLGMSPNTVKSWLSVLAATGLIRFLEPFYRNYGKRIVKSPKLYFMDTGLVCYLTGIRTVRELRDSVFIGAIFETLALGQLVRSFIHMGETPDIYFYRDHSGREVDFLIPRGEKLELFECKLAEEAPSQVPGFKALEAIAGPENIASKVLLTPVRGARHLESRGFTVRGLVDPRGNYPAMAAE
ncbi:MAG: ATP-binding protein [Acidobacteria bacterium]|nr:ATP-binding protein [Acidobacteriota bacterium]